MADLVWKLSLLIACSVGVLAFLLAGLCWMEERHYLVRRCLKLGVTMLVMVYFISLLK